MEFKRLLEEKNRLEILKSRDELTQEGLEILTELTQALQLQQTGVIKSVCDCAKDEFCCRCHESKGWKIENGKYVKQTVL